MRENLENIGYMGISRVGRPATRLISVGLSRSSEPRVGGSNPSECIENGVFLKALTKLATGFLTPPRPLCSVSLTPSMVFGAGTFCRSGGGR